ncbi:hypothetical protein JUJ52_03130 [Virgibacillus sp. AGTR]|uniref:hypothetical protein n=1 Tax=Virgibacillus sp. AGTR TaxID=2812055 RepID=UPI001D15E8B8|nr:hypothetical protein [Virgibacillus sp. AGTR]MCC2248951.1 hypothetical protein [Virgibacillus sp. AGTR]
MTNVSEIKKRMPPMRPQDGEWSMLFKGLQKQLAHVQQLAKEQTVTSGKQLHASDIQLQTLERIHDRLDAVMVESRVTNVLLSELVALHQTVITDNTDEVREAIRNDAYHRVRNAE